MKQAILSLAIVVALLSFGCIQGITRELEVDPNDLELGINFTNDTPPSAQIANPASVNCINLGGKLAIKKDSSGGEVGYCTLPSGAVCEEWALFRGECGAAKPPVACTMEYMPVCGSDGVTYGNKCMANSAGAKILYDGECASPGVANEKIAQSWIEKNSPTYLFDGIPGSIEKLEARQLATCKDCYQFVYSFKSSHAGYGDRSGKMLALKKTAHNITISVENGAVTWANTDDVFDEIRNTSICLALSAIIQVCGENGITYQHPCFAKEKGVAIAYEGACGSNAAPTGLPPLPAGFDCSKQDAPVCGVDGKTYPNQCYASALNVSLDYYGECRPKSGLITKEICESARGHFNECGSACRGAAPNTPCTLQCVQYCECGGIAGFGCPVGYVCSDLLPKGAVDAMGVCKPIV